MRKEIERPHLLSRQEFARLAFERDGHACVVCGRPENDGVRLDAHHIIERRLWSDGGYYLENAATLCDEGEQGCHYKAETTEISVENLRELCGISNLVLPDDMYPDHVYDKWGNTILEDGRRSRGPLFNDPSVQKVIAKFLPLFTPYVKYPRTFHLPFSPGVTEDDRVLKDCSVFEGREVIVTRKMDGENFSGYRGYCHARSIDGRSHESRDWAKNFWSAREWGFPEGWRICAENMFAVHSIRYDDLPGYLLGFSVWNDQNVCLSWDETVEWFDLLDMHMVPVLYRGKWNEGLVKSFYDEKKDYDVHEGYVVRIADSFAYRDFGKSIAKFVRANHVTTDRHWMRGRIIEPNGLADG